MGLAYLWARRFSPRKPGPEKNATYECGLESKGDAWIQFKSEYYLYAIIFLVFDVETIFLLPFAVLFTGLSKGAFVAMIVFLLLLAEGLAWAWQKVFDLEIIVMDEGLRSELSKQGIFTTKLEELLQLGQEEFRLAIAIWAGLLRNRNDCD